MITRLRVCLKILPRILTSRIKMKRVFFSDYDTPTSAGDPKERILDLLENSENEYCVDCQSPYPPEMGVYYKPKLE